MRCNPLCISGVVIGREGDVCVVSAPGDIGTDVEAKPEVPERKIGPLRPMRTELAAKDIAVERERSV